MLCAYSSSLNCVRDFKHGYQRKKRIKTLLTYFQLKKLFINIYLPIFSIALVSCTKAPEKITQVGNNYYNCKSQQTLPFECDDLYTAFEKAILEARVESTRLY